MPTMTPVQYVDGRTSPRNGQFGQSATASGRVVGLQGSLDHLLIRIALALNALLRDKHEGLNRGNADPPVAW